MKHNLEIMFVMEQYGCSLVIKLGIKHFDQFVRQAKGIP